MNLLNAELERRRQTDERQVTLAEMKQLLAALGYRLDRTMDCRCAARWLTGPAAGASYPCITTGIKEADTGLSAFNVHARRDDNFQALQSLRGKIYSVTKGRIFEI